LLDGGGCWKNQTLEKDFNMKKDIISIVCSCLQPIEVNISAVDQQFNCPSCGNLLTVPRPTRGYYALPSESDIENAELFHIVVREGMHRGELKELISDSIYNPTSEDLDNHSRRMYDRYIRNAKTPLEKKEAITNKKEWEKEKIQSIKEDIEEKLWELRIDEDRFFDSDWEEFYHHPNRKQFDAVYDWLNINKPGWNKSIDRFSNILCAIDKLFPNLRKK
jgi:predicted RNA-binding Zn-ribbon protein involved in translation (DUF1610 family)